MDQQGLPWPPWVSLAPFPLAVLVVSFRNLIPVTLGLSKYGTLKSISRRSRRSVPIQQFVSSCAPGFSCCKAHQQGLLPVQGPTVRPYLTSRTHSAGDCKRRVRLQFQLSRPEPHSPSSPSRWHRPLARELQGTCLCTGVLLSLVVFHWPWHCDGASAILALSRRGLA